MADYAEVDVDLKAHGRGQPIDEVGTNRKERRLIGTGEITTPPIF